MTFRRPQFGVRVLWSIFVLLPALAAAQQPANSQNTPVQNSPTQNSLINEPAATFKSRSDLVLVPVVVRDHDGKHVAGLSKDAFHLEENKKPQSISLFEEVHSSLVNAEPYKGSDQGFSNLPFNNAKETSPYDSRSRSSQHLDIAARRWPERLYKVIGERGHGKPAGIAGLHHQERSEIDPLFCHGSGIGH
jgi:hypothetical protein